MITLRPVDPVRDIWQADARAKCGMVFEAVANLIAYLCFRTILHRSASKHTHRNLCLLSSMTARKLRQSRSTNNTVNRMPRQQDLKSSMAGP